ncbi:MAG: hypothetical protein P8179_17930 [Candidatus Thiodiazotropha sp.]
MPKSTMKMIIKNKLSAIYRDLWSWVLLSLTLVVTVVIYYNGLAGPFIFDDFPNILNNEYIKLEKLTAENTYSAAFSTEAGPLARPVAMLSFALNYYWWGDEAYYYKLINLLIHGLNGILVFVFMRALLKETLKSKDSNITSDNFSFIALLVAAAWLMHPINLTSVLYVVQRMASLSATFVLATLILYLKGRLSWRNGNTRRSIIQMVIASLSAVFGIFTKENALLLPLYIFLIEWLVLLPNAPRHLQRTAFRWSAIIWFVIPITSIATYYITKGIWNSGFDGRLFNVSERLMTESRILVDYLGMIVVPRPGEFGVYHDDIQISTGLFSPWTTFVSILFLVALLVFAFRLRRSLPLFTFGVFFFFCAHLIESTVFPLELMHEHRNYLASSGILLALISSLFSFQKEKYHVSSTVQYGLTIVFCCFFAVITHSRVLAWQDLNRLSMTEVNNHPNSARAHYQAALVFTALARNEFGEVSFEYKQKAIDYFLMSADLNKQRDAGALLAAMLIYGLDNKGGMNSLLSVLSGDQENMMTLFIPSDLYERAVDSLRTEIITEEAVVGLIRMSDCERSRRCYYPEGVVDSLFAGLMENPRLNKHSYRAAALLDEVSLRKLQNNELDLAINLNGRAIEINPHMAMYKIHRAEMLDASGDVAAAMALINEVLSGALPESVRKLAVGLLESMKMKEAINRE